MSFLLFMYCDLVPPPPHHHHHHTHMHTLPLSQPQSSSDNPSNLHVYLNISYETKQLLEKVLDLQVSLSRRGGAAHWADGRRAQAAGSVGAHGNAATAAAAGPGSCVLAFALWAAHSLKLHQMMVMIVVCHIASYNDGDDSGMPHR